MSFTVTTNKDLKGKSVRLVSDDVFDQISALGGFGVRSTGFDASSTLAVNEKTQGFDQIMELLGEVASLDKMKKDELLAEAARLGVEVADGATKAEIIAAINEKDGKN